jgi:hypothetical protein
MVENPEIVPVSKFCENIVDARAGAAIRNRLLVIRINITYAKFRFIMLTLLTTLQPRLSSYILVCTCATHEQFASSMSLSNKVYFIVQIYLP